MSARTFRIVWVAIFAVSLDPEIRRDDGYPGPFARSVTVQLIGYEVVTTTFVKTPLDHPTKDPA
mgnify:CR=1 FL=1